MTWSFDPARSVRAGLTASGLLLACSAMAFAQAPEPIRYTLRFPAPHTHYVDVEMMVPTGSAPEIELMMAVWTPGSYLVREYARGIDAVSATSPAGYPLEVEKVRKNRWRISTASSPAVIVSYHVYCREMTVRTNWVENDFAMLNGAPTFLTLVEDGPRPHDVTLELPDAWAQTMTGLPALPGGGPHSYRAPDFDTLVDSPIVAGNPAVYEFEVDDKPHYLVNVGEDGIWDGPRSARDVEKIVREYRRMWGFLPYDRYLFLNMITEAGGGLEHKNSTLLMTSRWRTRTRDSYLGWLGTVSHEFFHAWNVKRLRPVELGPFDYEREVYTKSLWMAEGVTSYYGPLAIHRAGLSTRDEYLRSLSRTITGLQTTPGRLVQPVESASFDAWIKGYRPNENSPNTTISYYTKGAVIAFLLDAKIRKATGDVKTLDDVMRLVYRRHAGERGFAPDEFRAAAQEVASVDLTEWFVDALETTKELDYVEAVGWFGLRFKAEQAPEDDDPPRAWLGLVTRTAADRLVVSQVRRGTPAYDAGFNAGDEIVAVGDFRVQVGQWATRMRQYRPGEQISVLVARRGRLLRLETSLATRPGDAWRLEVDPDADVVHHRLRAWLSVS